MKKTLSIVLALLMICACAAPAFAEEAPEVNEEQYTINFVQPSEYFPGAYMFVQSVEGEIQFKEDPDGIYVFYDNRYMTLDNILPGYEHEAGDERYSPVVFDASYTAAKGETVAFQIMTSPEYNILTASVFVNGERAYVNAKGEYTVYVDRDITVHIAEFDENNQPVLLRNHYNVKLTSGDGYKVKTLKNENYGVVYYGGSFRFRVAVSDGYTGSGMKVSVQRGSSGLGGFLDEEDTDMLVGIMGGTEALTSYGVDEDGCRLYEIKNITTDCRIIISGVQEESNVGVMAMFKRILRLILNLLGIKLDILDSFTSYHTIKIDAAEADGVTYEVVCSSTDELSPKELTVLNGEGISIVVTKQSADQNVKVIWTPGNELGSAYDTNWILNYDTTTGTVTYSAIYNIDNITDDMVISITN